MNNCVITLSVGDDYDGMEITIPRMNNYCSKYNLNFIVIRDNHFKHPAYNKLLIKNYINDFDRILYIDLDVIIRNDAPNIFDIVPDDKFGIFNEEYLHICNCGKETIDLYNNYTSNNIKWNGEYYNTGVMLFNKDNIKILNDDIPLLEEYYADQGFINYQIHKYNIECFDIGFQFNGLNNPSIVGEERLKNSYFIHSNGGNTFKNKSESLKYEIDNVINIETKLGLC